MTGIAVLISALAAGCTSNAAPPAGSRSSAGVTTGAGRTTPASRSAPGSLPSTSPAYAAALGVAKATRNQIPQLHALAVATGTHNGFPAGQIPTTAKLLAAGLKTDLSNDTMLTPPPGSGAAELATALRAYLPLATQLTAWRPGHTLAATYAAQLRAADATWHSALTAVGTLTHQNLLANLPALLYPKA